MTAHVAERGEGRGRVVLRLTGTHAISEQAILAAIRVAKAFHSEIESLFVTDRQIFDAAGYGFVREIVAAPAARGGASRRSSQNHAMADGGSAADSGSADAVPAGLNVGAIARQIDLAARALRRRVGELAQREDVPVLDRQVNDTPLRALAHACQIAGPWNVVALGEPFSANGLARLDQLFERVTGMTGVVLVGPRAVPSQGPVVALIEDSDRVMGMLRAAERVASASGSDVVLGVVAQSRARQAWLRSEVVHAIAGHAVQVVDIGRPGGGTAVLAEAVRQLRPGFVFAEHGGQLVPHSGDFAPLVAALSCPLLVVR